jgi:hypothetical protein
MTKIRMIILDIYKLTQTKSMKTKLLLLVSLTAFLSCQSPNAETEMQEEQLPEASKDVLQAESSTLVDQTSPIRENDEYLDWGSILINGKSPLAASVKNIEDILGRADSVVSINWMETCSSRYVSEDSRNAYFGGVQFEKFGDSLDFMHVNFSKDHSVFLQSGNLKLNHTSTLEEVEKHFPKAVKNIRKNLYHIDGKETDAVSLPPSKEFSDAQWILMFQQGRLIRIDLWFPC